MTELRIAGFGGQGVILAGMVIGRAATIYDNKFVTLTQSFGPEARGSACSVQLIVSPEPVLYPYITRPDILVVMSQEACARFCCDIKPGGLLLYEQDLIKLSKKCAPDVKPLGIPATRLAEELGRKLVLNMVMVGFVTAITSLTSAEAGRKSVADSVPKGTEKLNLAAFDKGYEYGRTFLTARDAA
ncbi:MAG: 2-oxoacid:acceptor oxidoreductase family protein [Acidobacteriia bacterium]|nr:2-oxoacid:acceptor oxidoreductase family protein [Terriglobia bacterium]